MTEHADNNKPLDSEELETVNNKKSQIVSEFSEEMEFLMAAFPDKEMSVLKDKKSNQIICYGLNLQ